MRDNDGRKVDHATLAAMRVRAVAQVRAGAHPEDVAAVLGLHRSTVFGWVATYREGGPDALQARPVPGRPPKLSGEQVRRLYTLIVGHDPRQLEFEFGLWTRQMVRALIRREFGVALSVVSVGRLLRRWGCPRSGRWGGPISKTRTRSSAGSRRSSRRCAPRPPSRARRSSFWMRPACAAITP